MADERTKLKLALGLAKRGLYIAPLRPKTKLPYFGESWSAMRSRDPNTITQWFKERPDMNYAVIGGEEFVILDLDTKKGKTGPADLEAIALENEDYNDTIKETFVVTTPTKGEHRYFKCDFPASNAHTFPKSIDIRGNDGYVVGPGCSTAEDPENNTVEGEYTVTNKADIMPLPDWAAARLTRSIPKSERPSYADNVEIIDGKAYVDGVELDQPQRVQRAIEWLKEGAEPAIEYQGGNETTYRTFAWLREHAISVDLALNLVAKYYNPRCATASGEPCPWSYEELERIRDNAYKYAKREVSEAGGLLNRGQTEEEIIAESENIDSETFLRQFAAHQEGAKNRALVEGILEQRKADDSLDAHTWYGDNVLQYPAIKEFVIPRVLPAAGYVGFLARRGTGKTTIMMDLALRLAHDMDWHGQPMKMGWGAIVLAGEDPEGAKEQILAWMRMHGVETLSPRFVWMDTIANLLDAASIAKWSEHLRKIAGNTRFVVFGDTWQIATALGKQNEDDSMQTAIHHVKQLAKAVRGPCVMAAHPPKGNEDTWSGSAVMENHSQALWKLSKATHCMMFSVPRIKGTKADYSAMFEFKVQMLGGHDEWGNPNSGIVPIKIGGEGVALSADALEKTRKARQTYADVIYAMMTKAEEEEENFSRRRHTAFSMASVSRQIATMTANQEMAAKKLASLGEITNDEKLVRARLEELFKVKKAVTVDIVGGNAVQIFLYQAPGQKIAYFRTTAAKMATLEPDEQQQIPPDESVQKESLAPDSD